LSADGILIPHLTASPDRWQQFKMNKYQFSNLTINFQKLIFIFVLTLAHIMVLITVEFPIYLKIFSITLNAILAVFIVLLYNKNAFTFSFTENKIVQRFTYSSIVIEFDYTDLVSVKYNQFSKSPNVNIFVLAKYNKKYSVKTEALVDAEKYIGFIKWLKTKSTSFETYVYPKGSLLHMRLRQEILGKEF